MSFLSLQQLYQYFPELATAGPKDEALRAIIDDAENVVLADLRNLGFDTTRISEDAVPQVRRLVLFRVLADVLIPPLAGKVEPALAQYYEQKYRLELQDIAKKPDRMGNTPRTSLPNLPCFVNPPRRSRFQFRI